MSNSSTIKSTATGRSYNTPLGNCKSRDVVYCAECILNRIKDNIPLELHKSLYHTLFESHLPYGITAWGGVSDKKLQSIFKV